jgi:hypothetical protein
MIFVFTGHDFGGFGFLHERENGGQYDDNPKNNSQIEL